MSVGEPLQSLETMLQRVELLMIKFLVVEKVQDVQQRQNSEAQTDEPAEAVETECAERGGTGSGV